MIDHRTSSNKHNLSSCEIKARKNLGLNGIQTHDLCDTCAVLYQLSYQAIWELLNSYLSWQFKCIIFYMFICICISLAMDYMHNYHYVFVFASYIKKVKSLYTSLCVSDTSLSGPSGRSLSWFP